MVSISRTYIPGERLVECQVCGFDYRFSEVTRGVSGKQKGLIVCKDPCFDPVHPRDVKRVLRPKRPLPQVK